MLLKHCRGAHLVSLYLRTFLRTMRDNWGKMDYHRMDKFYTLVRFVMNSVYTYMAKRAYHPGLVRLLNDAMFEEALQVVNKNGKMMIYSSNGLRLHLIDVVMVEFEKTFQQPSSDEFYNDNDNENDDKEVLQVTKSDVFLMVFEPFFAKLQTERDEAVFTRLTDAFAKHAVVSEDIAQFYFDLGSDEATLDRHREKLYGLYKDMKVKLNEEKRRKEKEAEEAAAVAAAKLKEEMESKAKKSAKKKKRKSSADLSESASDKSIRSSKKKGKKGNPTREKEIPLADEEKSLNTTTSRKKKQKLSVKDSTKTSEIDTTVNKKREKKGKAVVKETTEDIRDDKAHVEGNISYDMGEMSGSMSTPPNTPVEVKKKKSKKEKKSEKELKEEEIIISLKEQQAAKKKAKKTKVLDSNTKDQKPVKSVGKSVKWTENESKSYKESMRGIRNVELDLSLTPEKSILLKKEHKDEKSNSSSRKKKLTGKKQRRKKATDWM